jgi:hypothetical protein
MKRVSCEDYVLPDRILFSMALASVVVQTGHWDIRVAFHSTPKDGVYILMMYSVQ